MLQSILNAYGLKENEVTLKTFGTGLINHTWLVEAAKHDYILQRINPSIFKQPEDIAANIRMIGDYLAKTYPAYLFVSAEKTSSGQDMIYQPGEGYFRLFHFVPNSKSIDVVNTPHQAFEAAA